MERNYNPPSSGPRGLGPLAVGTYTKIAGFYGPSEVLAGEVVDYRIEVKNLYSSQIYIALAGQYDSGQTFPKPDYAIVNPGATYNFIATVIMPGKDINLQIWSFYWSEPDWIQDDYDSALIRLKTLAPEFGSFGITQYNKV